MNLTEYDIKDATHLLKCRHQIARNGYNYTMPCIVIGKTKSRKTKVVVFGDRARNHNNAHKKIRYVWPWQIKESEKSND